jgi:AcrR family transcriptional regulator
MGRSSTIDEPRVFAAVARRLSTGGTMTLQAVVTETGVSVGSLYHRYGSREGLLAQTWLDAVHAFHAAFLKEIDQETEDAGEQAALATPRFCRSDRDRAVVLACCRRSEFFSDATPSVLREQIEHVNDEAIAAIRRYAKRTGHALEACRLGLVAFPLGAVRLYLPAQSVPASVDGYVLAAFRAVMRTDRKGHAV